MKHIKNALAILLVLSLSLTLLCACSGTQDAPQGDEPKQEETAKVSVGILNAIGTSEEELNASSEDATYTFFDTLNSMLLALKAGKIDRADNIPDCVGYYVTANNETIQLQKPSSKRSAVLKYHMGVMNDRTDLQKKLNDTIAAMKDDGTLQELTKTYIDGYVIKGRTPDVIEIPEIEGAETLNVAVTGDIPPLDFVTADGNPAGFNVAVLAEISKRLNVNINLVNVDSAARAVTLTSGKADILFWVATLEFVDSALNNEAICNADVPQNVALTEAYYTSDSGQLALK